MCRGFTRPPPRLGWGDPGADRRIARAPAYRTRPYRSHASSAYETLSAYETCFVSVESSSAISVSTAAALR